MNLYIVSLGCDKNRVDTEKLLHAFFKEYENCNICEDPEDADIAIINTCAFIKDAQEESVNTIIELGEFKEYGRLSRIIVCGCLAERYKDELIKLMPEIDSIHTLTEYLDTLEKSDERMPTVESYSSYIKIAEGCNKYCTYCIIPYLRGRYRSRPMEVIINEAKKLADNGCRELVIVAQETSLYGTDIYGGKKLPELINKLSEIEGIDWIRVLYCYPEEINDELIECMKTNPKFLHYLDLPIQHASDRILKAMNRRTKRAEIETLIKKLRQEVPDICIRTTLISGFPGETEEDHEILKNFVKDMRFNRLGVFTYSQEEGTVAAGMEDQIPEDIKEERRNEIMALQQEIAFENAREQIGRHLKAIITAYIPERKLYIGRTYMDASDIDSYVFIESDNNNFISGDIIDVEVTDATDYDLFAKVL